MKQALITEYQQSLMYRYEEEKETDRFIWHINIIAGALNGVRDVSGEDADIAWESTTRAVREIISLVAQNDDAVYMLGVSAANLVTGFAPERSASQTWISDSPHQGVPANVLRRVPPSDFPRETWWPGRWSASGTAMSFPTCSGEYRENLDKALVAGDLNRAVHLMFVSDQFGPVSHLPSSFASTPSVMDEVTFYMKGGAHAKSVLGVNFYSKRLESGSFLSTALMVLAEAGYQSFRGRGLDTFKEWATAGRLPAGLEIL